MAKTTGYGAQLKITIATVLTLVAQIKEIEFPEQEADLAEVTTHDSTSGYAEWIKTGLFRFNKMTCTLVWTPALATAVAMQAAFAATTGVVFTIASAGPTETITFTGLISKVGRTSSSKGAYEAKFEIMPTGVPTIALPA